jgi:peptidoglycan-N-acetylglucosamine deacetylase
MLKPMPPSEPDDCRRRNRWRLRLLVLPSVAVLGLALGGEPRLAAGLFVAVGYVLMLGTLRPSSHLFGPLVRELSAAQAARGEVWLTFDDGPDPQTTPILLDCLARHGVRAGFFLIGEKARRHPELVRAIAAAGHLIGNHSQTHAAGRFWGLPPAAMWREIAGCQQTLTELLGSPPTLFRPPVGHHNPFVWPPLQALGLKMVLWNCRGFDAVLRDPAAVRRRLEAGLRPGAIVLLHEGRADAGELLEQVLQTLAACGLRPALPNFVVSENNVNYQSYNQITE